MAGRMLPRRSMARSVTPRIEGSKPRDRRAELGDPIDLQVRRRIAPIDLGLGVLALPDVDRRCRVSEPAFDPTEDRRLVVDEGGARAGKPPGELVEMLFFMHEHED